MTEQDFRGENVQNEDFFELDHVPDMSPEVLALSGIPQIEEAVDLLPKDHDMQLVSEGLRGSGRFEMNLEVEDHPEIAGKRRLSPGAKRALIVAAVGAGGVGIAVIRHAVWGPKARK